MVDELLADAEQSPGYAEWKAPLLRLRAKHCMFQNDFSAAKECFDNALEACNERAFGPLRGEIAREAFATRVAIDGLNLQNDEHYYRQVIAYSEFPESRKSFPDAAADCEDFFWSGLYRPYPGVERIEGIGKTQYQSLFRETIPLIAKADWEGFKKWLNANKGKFNKNIKEARRNSVLLAWMKGRQHFRSDVRQNMLVAIRHLLEAWPNQAKISDFKGQTPFMLAADDGDFELVRLLAPLSDIDQQDHLGRTALHAAASGGSLDCVQLVLEHEPLVADKLTAVERHTALHTAIRFGNAEIVRHIAQDFPSLVDQVNSEGQTPLELAQDILNCYSDWSDYMQRNSRHCGSYEDFESIVRLLEVDNGVAVH